MVDEVEIKNVGGKFGVASEATLQLLLDSMSKDSPSRRRMEQIVERSQRNLSRSTTTLNERQGILSKTVGVASDAVSLLAKEMTDTTTRLSNLVETIIGSGNVLTRGINTVVGAIDDSVDRFRELSSVGASFNNSIFDMITAAQSSYLSLDEFSRLIMSNSDTLRLLGGNVTMGAKRFGELNRQLRTSDFGRQLFNMGYTFGEVNDTLASYLDLASRDLRQRVLTDRELLTGTQLYVMELERLTKITGMSRKQAQDAMAGQMQDIRIRAALANMTQDEQVRFQNNIAAAGNVSDQLVNVFADLSDGNVTDPLTAAFVSMFPQVRRIAAEMKDMDPYEFNNQMALLGDEMGNYAAAYPDLIQGLIASGDPIGVLFADIAARASDLVIMTEDQIAAAEEERLATERITSTFANFENAWNNFMKFITSGFTNSPAFTELSNLGANFVSLTDENSEGSVSWLMSEIERFNNEFFGDSGVITNALRDFNEFLSSPEGRDAISNFFTVLRDTANQILDFFLGERVTSGPPDERVTERVGGLFERIYDEFDAVFKGEKTVLDVIYEGFKNTFTWLVQALSNTIGPIIKDFLFGQQVGYGEGAIDPGLAAAAGIVEDGGFIQTLTDGFWNILETINDQIIRFWEGPNGVELKNTISGFFEDLINQITVKLTGSGTGSATSIAEGTGMSPDLYTGVAQSLLGESVASYLPGTGYNVGSLSADAFLEQANDWFANRGSYSLLGDSREEIEETARSWISDTLNHLMSPEGGGLSREMAKQQIRQGLMDFMSTPGRYNAEEFDTMRRYMTETVLPRLDSFSNGTSGFQNFGKESMAALHGVEAVVPRNTPAGDFLDQYFTNNWQPKTNAFGSEKNNTSQDNLVKYLIQLNSTMVAVLSEIRKTNDLEKQTLNSMRGMGGDLFRSV